MNLKVSSVNFDGRKNPKLHLRRRQLKNLKLQELNIIINKQEMIEKLITILKRFVLPKMILLVKL